MEIKLRNVSYEKDGNTLINNISYVFKSETITSIIGTSGSGKTLLSYLMIGLINHTYGDIIIGNKRISKNNIYSIRKNIGYIFQNPEESFVGLTVKDEVGYSLNKYNHKLEKKDKIILQAIEMVGLDKSFLNRDINTLSSGEQELIAIASSLVLNPKILILDEPTINLDNKNINRLTRLLKRINKEYHKTIIILSNNIDFVYQISNDILLLDQGKKINNFTSNKLIKYNMEVPKIIEFIDYINKQKKIDIDYTTDINDLVKGISNNV